MKNIVTSLDFRDVGIIDLDTIRKIQSEIPSRKIEEKTHKIRQKNTEAIYYCFECQMKYHKRAHLIKHYKSTGHCQEW
jgi:hypothetical protein